MRSVFDQQGEGWLPGSPQANQAQDAAARKMGYNNAAEARAAGKTLPTTAEDVAKFWGQSQPASRPAGSKIPGKPGAVADGQGGWSYPGGPQTANVYSSATQGAPRPASVPQQPAPRPTQAPAPGSTTKPNNVPAGFGTPKSANPLTGETLKSRLAWADKTGMNIAGHRPSFILKNPDLFNKLFDEKKLTSEQAGFLLSEASYLHTRFGHRAFGNNMTRRDNYGGPLSKQQNQFPAIPRISTPAPQNQSTTQSQDPGFLNMPTPRISSTPAPSSSSGTQFRMIDGILRPINAPPATTQPAPAKTGMI